MRSLGVVRIHLAQDRNQGWAVVNTIMNLQVSIMVGNFLTIGASISFSRPLPEGI
jgi:hypothetical protein